jgi:peptidoglycan hydrolase-like protein with peptidoglycan-binding domain
MTDPLLKLGSKGKNVGLLQKLLNLKGKLPNPIEEDEIFGPETKEAVKFFQKKAGLQVDGIVGPEAGAALSKLAGGQAAPLVKFLGEPDDGEDGESDGKHKAANGKKEDKTYNFTCQGKSYALNKAEYDDVNKKVVAEIRRTALLAAQLRVDAARTLWDSFNEINNDQYVVSWFVSLGGPKLPDQGVVQRAEQALQRLVASVGGGDCAKAAKAFTKEAADAITKAYESMMTYQEAVTHRSGTWLAGLEFTRDTSFDVVQMIATAELGGSPAAGAAAGAGAELVKSAANELGKCLAGSGGGASAAKNVAIDVILGAGSGAISTLIKIKGDKIIEGLAETGAKKIAGKWMGKLGTAKVEKFLAKRLEGGLKGAVDGAIKNSVKAIKSRTTPAEFIENVAMEIGFGALLNGLDGFIEGKDFPQKVFQKINTSSRSKFFGKLKDKDAIELLAEVMKDKGKEPIKKALEGIIDKAKGEESEKELADDLVEEFNKSGLSTLEAELIKRSKEHKDNKDPKGAKGK